MNGRLLAGFILSMCFWACFKPVDGDVRDAGSDAGDSDAGPQTGCGAPGDIWSYGPELEGCTILRGSALLRCADNTKLMYLSSLRVVEGSFQVLQCLDLQDLTGLERLESVGQLGISQNPLVKDLLPLSNLRTATEILGIAQMPGLVNLKGLERVQSTRSVTVRLNDNLETLDGLSGLTSVDELWISSNPALKSLAGLSSLRTVRGRVEISFNAGLRKSEIDAFLARVQVLGELDLTGNAP